MLDLLGGSDAKESWMHKTWVRSLGWEDPLEEGMETHSSILAWRIPIDRGAWWAPAHGVTKSQTWVDDSAHNIGLLWVKHCGKHHYLLSYFIVIIALGRRNGNSNNNNVITVLPIISKKKLRPHTSLLVRSGVRMKTGLFVCAPAHHAHCLMLGNSPILDLQGSIYTLSKKLP